MNDMNIKPLSSFLLFSDILSCQSAIKQSFLTSIIHVHAVWSGRWSADTEEGQVGCGYHYRVQTEGHQEALLHISGHLLHNASGKPMNNQDLYVQIVVFTGPDSVLCVIKSENACLSY